MSKPEIKSISVKLDVPMDCFKRLRIFSIEKDMTVTQSIQYIVERFISNKKVTSVEEGSS